MTNQRKRIFVQHPTYGIFEAVGETNTEASKKCLRKISKALIALKMDKELIKVELTRVGRLITKNVNKVTK